jgi:exopolysaccharide production protein ExoZ
MNRVSWSANLVTSTQIENRHHCHRRPFGFDLMRVFTSFISQRLSQALEIADRPGRVIQMEGMRGYAVLLVFLVHHHNLFSSYLPASSALYSLSQFGNVIGHSGVDLFFVLSGFLIYGHLIRKPVPYLSFCLRRLHRIYPTFLVVFGTYILLCHLIPSVSKLPLALSKEVLYLVENALLLPGIVGIAPLVTVAWSLSYEFFFYLSIPLIITLTGMRVWRRSSRISFFACLALVHFVGYRFGMLPHIRLTMFLAGVLLCEITDAGWLKTKLSRKGEFLIIGGYLATLFSLGFFRLVNLNNVSQPAVPEYPSVIWTGLLWIALFGLTTYCFIFGGALKRIFSYTPLRWLGNMSYSYFLFHGLVLNGVAFSMEHLIRPETKSMLLFLVLLAANLLLTVSGSLALFLLVEKPFSLAVKRSNVAAAPSRQFSMSAVAPGRETEPQLVRGDKERVCSE